MENTKFKTKILLVETLEALPVSGRIRIFFHEFKPDYVRAAATKLSRKGMKFSVNGKGSADSVVVTRTA